MSILKDILVEERDRLKDLVKMYCHEIARFPKGSLSIKSICNGVYAYRAYRNRDKVKFEYLGVAESKKALAFKDRMESRRKFNSLLKDAKRNLMEVERMLRVAKA